MPHLFESNILFYSSELAALGIPKTTIYRHKDLGYLEEVQAKGGSAFVFSSMARNWREKIQAFYNGDVLQHVQFQTIDDRLRCPVGDQEVLRQYRLDSGVALDRKRMTMYQQACALLALLKELKPFSPYRVMDFGVQCKADFLKLVYDYIGFKGLKLPRSKRLLQTLKRYIQEGATAIISGKLGMRNAAKIGQQEIDLLVALYADVNGRKFTKRQVWEQFKFIAKEKGWKHCESITYQAVAKVLTDHTGEWFQARHGEKVTQLDRTLSIQRVRPTKPNLVWQLDGTPEHVWYYCPDRKTVDRLYVLKVMDACTWRIMGYSIGTVENSNLVFEAMKMACKLNGTKPREVRVDKGSAMQAQQTKDLMQQLGANFFPTKSGNARGKTIESWQKHFNQKVLTHFVNKSGGNITAKDLNSQQNPDAFKRNYKSYPTKEELIGQIRLAMELWNESPTSTKSQSKGKTPNEIYTTKEHGGHDLDTLEQFNLFAVWRRKGKAFRAYKMDYKGIQVEIDKLQYRYLPELPADKLAAFLNKHMGTTTFYIKYDPSDLSQVALYVLPQGAKKAAPNMRFLCHAVIKKMVSETPLEGTPEDRRQLRHYRTVQDEQMQQPKDSMEARRQRLEDANILTGAIDIQKVYKDRYNAAKIAVERQRLLGYDNTLPADRNRELSRESMEAGDPHLKDYFEASADPEEPEDLYLKDIDFGGFDDDYNDPYLG